MSNEYKLEGKYTKGNQNKSYFIGNTPQNFNNCSRGGAAVSKFELQQVDNILK